MDRMLKLSFVCLTFVALVGCSGQPTESTATPPAGDATATTPPPSNGARTLPIPGASPGADASGHGSGHLHWDIPASWTEETPSSNMRLAQYKISGPDGDGECIVFYFGPGQGGDPASNATRWAGQFAQPDGRDSTELMTFGPLDQTAVPVQVVEVTGTYDGGMSGPIDATGYMLLGGIAEGPDAPWFFKFIGPESTVRANRDAFISMMRSLRTDG